MLGISVILSYAVFVYLCFCEFLFVYLCICICVFDSPEYHVWCPWTLGFSKIQHMLGISGTSSQAVFVYLWICNCIFVYLWICICVFVYLRPARKTTDPLPTVTCTEQARNSSRKLGYNSIFECEVKNQLSKVWSGYWLFIQEQNIWMSKVSSIKLS